MKMGMSTGYQRKPEERKGLNPIWRGIGCMLMVFVPLITFGLTVIISPFVIATGYVPFELMGNIKFPDWVYRAPVLGQISSFIASINNLWLGVVLFIVILLLLTGLFSLGYVTILQFIGPPRYREMDAPPSRHKAKAYKR
jgi:hypothetical protein